MSHPLPEAPNGATDRSAILADSDYARRLAIEALQNGRLELGAGLARLAVNAARAAHAILTHPRTAAVPLLGSTRDEQPARPSPAAAAEALAAGETVTMPRSSRCQDTTGRREGFPVKCWGQIYLEQDTGVWRHVNAPLDAKHTPIPRDEDNR